MTFEEAGKQQEENKKRDMATKYKDGGIYSLIRESMSDYGSPESKLAAATTALAMIAYNEMIDRRWQK